MDELLTQLSDAVAAQNWIVVVPVAALVLVSIVSVVLKALGKPVPILDSILNLGKGVVKVLPAKKAPAPVDPAKDGIANVVKITDVEKKQ